MQYRLKVAGSVAALALAFAIGAGTGLQLQSAPHSARYVDLLRTATTTQDLSDLFIPPSVPDSVRYVDLLSGHTARQIGGICAAALRGKEYTDGTLPGACWKALRVEQQRGGIKP